MRTHSPSETTIAHGPFLLPVQVVHRPVHSVGYRTCRRIGLPVSLHFHKLGKTWHSLLEARRCTAAPVASWHGEPVVAGIGLLSSEPHGFSSRLPSSCHLLFFCRLRCSFFHLPLSSAHPLLSYPADVCPVPLLVASPILVATDGLLVSRSRASQRFLTHRTLLQRLTMDFF